MPEAFLLPEALACDPSFSARTPVPRFLVDKLLAVELSQGILICSCVKAHFASVRIMCSRPYRMPPLREGSNISWQYRASWMA